LSEIDGRTCAGLSNLPKGFQRFGMLRNFCAGVSTDLGQGLGLLRVKSLPGVNPKARFGLNLDSTEGRICAEKRLWWCLSVCVLC